MFFSLLFLAITAGRNNVELCMTMMKRVIVSSALYHEIIKASHGDKLDEWGFSSLLKHN
jgi:hypothetical protein